MNCPGYVNNCINMLEASGHSAYAVGGAVRDSLLGKDPFDWDVTTSATPNEIIEVFSSFRTVPTGIKHGTVTVLFEIEGKSAPIEITTFRIDGEYHDSRHPDSVEFSSKLTDDLSRRDFTINAMAYCERDGIVDVFGGREDLAGGIIRTVGDAEKRFSEDALRILRAFRFSAQLGFEIEEKTLNAASKCAPLLKNIARERVGVEFKKLLSSTKPVYALQTMIEMGIWCELFGEILPDKSIIVKLETLENCFETRLAVLISDLSLDEKEELLTSLRLSNNKKKEIMKLSTVKSFVLDASFEKNEVQARRFLHLYSSVAEQGLQLLKFWGKDHFAELVSAQMQKKVPLSIADLDVRGTDLLPLCEGDHKRVGLILAYLLERVIEDPSQNHKEILIELAKKNLG